MSDYAQHAPREIQDDVLHAAPLENRSRLFLLIR